jgi:hypothetical protein
MKAKNRASAKHRGLRVVSKMPKFEFNMKAIDEIKRRKKRMRERFLKQFKKGRR